MGAAPVLKILRDGEELESHTLVGETLLGRGDGCVIRLEDRAISRQHALLRSLPVGVQIERKSEFSPLVVNGAEITSAVLKDGDVISIGPYLMKLSVPKESPRQIETQTLLETAPPSETLTVPIPSITGPLTEIIAPTLALLEPSQTEAAPKDSAQAEAPQTVPVLIEGAQAMEAAPAASEPASPAIPPISLEYDPIENEDAATRIIPAGKVAIRLLFRPGTANVEQYELTKDEISIGRGQNCDIILNDKKSSRKNSVIRRKGINFVIKDLNSANGTYVNGVRVEEQELSGDDTVKVGSVEFQFKALSADYLAREKNFMSVPQNEESTNAAGDESDLPPDIPFVMGGAPSPHASVAEVIVPPQVGGGGRVVPPAFNPPSSDNVLPGIGPVPGFTGIPGMGGAETKKRKSIIFDRFRQLSPARQMIVTVIVLLGVYAFLFMDEEEEVTKPKTVATKGVSAGTGKRGATFDSLTAEQKRFVEAQHNLAFDYYTAGEYDKAIYEVNRIFELIPDYKQAREIKRYAEEGKRKRDAIEQERQRAEQEKQLKAKVAQLVEEAKLRMKNKEYEQAKELFTQIVTIDPENPDVAGWRKEIEDWEEKKRLDDQAKRVQEDINARGWDMFKEATAFRKKGKYHTALEGYQKVLDVGVTEPKLISVARAMIRKCKALIAALRDPVLNEAKVAEESGEFAKAFQLFQRATKIDPPHPAGYAGMSRVRGILHDRAKMVYTEAVLAESYSDFRTAKKKFKECMEMSPTDDIYYERSKRKLARYFQREDVL